MSAPSEPEKYSIDEMMERLKNRPAEDPIESGELVTRSDGSQAIRVRKRKRRSHQPQKDEQRMNRRARMIQISGALILLLLALFAGGAAIVYANSAPFRENLVKRIAASTGAAVTMEQFRMNPTSANANVLQMDWPEGNALSRLFLRGVGAEIFPASFLGKSMVGEEVKANQGQLFIRIPQAGKPTTHSVDESQLGKIRFKRYAISKLEVRIGDPEAALLWMYNSEASFESVNSSGLPQLLLNRGDVGLPGWQPLRMDRSHIEFRGQDLDVIGMRLHHETDNRGEFELSGTISPYLADRASSLNVHLDAFLLSGIAGRDLGRLFNGRVDSVSSAKSNYLTFSPGESSAGSLAVEFRSTLATDFEVTGFPFLASIAQLLEDEWFERPVFDADVTGNLRRQGGNIVLGNLNMQSKGRLSLVANLTQNPARGLSGKLDVGVAEAMIKSSRNQKLDSMFGPAKEGFRWLTLTISGSTNSPIDNFRELYDAAKKSSDSQGSGSVPSFEELTRPE